MECRSAFREDFFREQKGFVVGQEFGEMWPMLTGSNRLVAIEDAVSCAALDPMLKTIFTHCLKK